jgi:hypothetical protein
MPANGKKFTRQQLADFAIYEKMRYSCKYNMKMWYAIVDSGLPLNRYVFICQNYHDLKAAALQTETEARP